MINVPKQSFELEDCFVARRIGQNKNDFTRPSQWRNKQLFSFNHHSYATAKTEKRFIPLFTGEGFDGV